MRAFGIALLALAALTPAARARPSRLQATAQELPWSIALQDATSGVLVKVRMVSLQKGYAVEFRNDGTSAIQFNFLLGGKQNRQQGQGNGMVCLEPGDESGALFVKLPGGGKDPQVDLFHIRLGHEEQGLFWRD